MADRRKSVNSLAVDRRSGVDRRCALRYDTNGLPVWVTWQEGAQRGCGQGRLRDLSLSGASLLMEEPPPVSALVRIRLETMPNAPHVEGSALRVTKTRRFLATEFVIALRFAEPCPYEFFTAAVYR